LSSLTITSYSIPVLSNSSIIVANANLPSLVNDVVTLSFLEYTPKSTTELGYSCATFNANNEVIPDISLLFVI